MEQEAINLWKLGQEVIVEGWRVVEGMDPTFLWASIKYPTDYTLHPLHTFHTLHYSKGKYIPL
jgi:hypothetical protein